MQERSTEKQQVAAGKYMQKGGECPRRVTAGTGEGGSNERCNERCNRRGEEGGDGTVDGARGSESRTSHHYAGMMGEWRR